MIYFLMYVLSHDIWFYFIHVVLHHPTIYWIHKEHHKNNPPNYSDAYVGHIIEIGGQNIGVFIPCLLGYIDYRSLLFAGLVIHIRNLIRHDTRCNFLTGNHHLLHHAYLNCNYGEYWIDSLLGTAYNDNKNDANNKKYTYGLIYT